MQPQRWSAMLDVAADMVRLHRVTVLVSGGAAFADHVAVRLFLDKVVPELRLHMPAPFIREFSGHPDAAIANRYHQAFSGAVGCDSLGEIASAVTAGARLVPGPFGFLDRNTSIARDCDVLLAFTRGTLDRCWSPEEVGFSDAACAGIGSRGTADTWRKAWTAQAKRHVPLAPL